MRLRSGKSKDPAHRHRRQRRQCGTNAAYTIDIAGSISLSTALLALNLDSGSSLATAGPTILKLLTGDTLPCPTAEAPPGSTRHAA